MKIVYSHPQALAQCEQYLKELGVTVEAVYDTAGGAKLVAEQKLTGAAALASRRAAEVFGLEVLQEAVQDFEYNITRFFVIGGAPPAEANKTTIVFALPSTPGSLFKALSVFALRDINLTKLESRPMRGPPWEYLFYVDIEARRDDLPTGARADAARRVREVDARPGHVQGVGTGEDGASREAESGVSLVELLESRLPATPWRCFASTSCSGYRPGSRVPTIALPQRARGVSAGSRLPPSGIGTLQREQPVAD